jgi:hypothetical protein
MPEPLRGTPEYTGKTTMGQMELWELLPTLDYGFTDHLQVEDWDYDTPLTPYNYCMSRLVLEPSSLQFTDRDLRTILDQLTSRLTDPTDTRDKDECNRDIGRILRHARALWLKLEHEDNNFNRTSWAQCIDTAMIWEFG